MSVSIARRASSSGGSQHKQPSAQFENQRDEIKRRQSIKYQFPSFMFSEEEEAQLFNESNVKEEDIRREVFGPPLRETTTIYIDSTVTRPTTASARRSVLWSRERKSYEEEHSKTMREFKTRPYMQHKYPEIKKHYPGTWRVVGPQELESIVDRLSRPTTCSRNRRAESASMLNRRARSNVSNTSSRVHTPQSYIYHGY
ncbi:uncharacterized protein LOC111122989 [Crassostrea virginica]|uniref:Uncharacterized protein LOC111122843 n=1 Tax=Crassostrea virginica TaxID=6565 RepID=A0A8B8CZ84_CRAVI|nr:uncharacterized protein LOC111122843 [Crassostrea virginica]